MNIDKMLPNKTIDVKSGWAFFSYFESRVKKVNIKDCKFCSI